MKKDGESNKPIQENGEGHIEPCSDQGGYDFTRAFNNQDTIKRKV